MTPTIDDTRAFIEACARGDGAARRAFQAEFAEDVYNFPVRIYGVAVDRAADFYLYAFEDDRIFNRLRSFEGRNAIQLRTFLSYYVLRGLFLDWQRGRRELDTVSLDDPATADGTPLGERLAAPEPEEPRALDDTAPAAALWAEMAPEERLDLKLLSLLEYDLDAADLQLLARLGKRSIEETRALVELVRTTLRGKDERVAALGAELDGTWGWIVLRRRELQETDERLQRLGEGRTASHARLEERHAALAASLAKRLRQRERLLEEIRTYKVTTPYKDIARLKGSTVGTVCSRIFRLRERLEARWQATEAKP